MALSTLTASTHRRNENVNIIVFESGTFDTVRGVYSAACTHKLRHAHHSNYSRWWSGRRRSNRMWIPFKKRANASGSTPNKRVCDIIAPQTRTRNSKSIKISHNLTQLVTFIYSLFTDREMSAHAHTDKRAPFDSNSRWFYRAAYSRISFSIFPHRIDDSTSSPNVQCKPFNHSHSICFCACYIKIFIF